MEYETPENITIDKKAKLIQQHYEYCLSSTKAEIKELQLKIEAENKE